MGSEIRSKYRITHTYIRRIHYKLPFVLSNKIELFERMRSLGYVMPYPCAAIYNLAMAMHSMRYAYL